MLPHCLELDSTITIPTEKGISRGRSPTRFSDPKFAYKPKPQPLWKKQTMYEEPVDTPVGRITEKSWKSILKTGKALENSGMVTKIIPVLPTVPTIEEPMTDFYGEPPTIILPKEKTMNDLEDEIQLQEEQMKSRTMSRSLPKRSSSVKRHLNTSRMDITSRTAAPTRATRTRMSYTMQPKSRSLLDTQTVPMRVMPRPRLGSSMSK